jgi:hypothetical protein
MSGNEMGMLSNGQQQQQDPGQNGNGNGGNGFGGHQFLQQENIEASRTTPADLSNIVHLKRSEAYFMSDELRSEILRKNQLSISMPAQELAIRMSIFFFAKLNRF